MIELRAVVAIDRSKIFEPLIKAWIVVRCALEIRLTMEGLAFWANLDLLGISSVNVLGPDGLLLCLDLLLSRQG